MEERPKNVIIASAAAALGAVFVLAVFIIEFDINASDLAIKTAFYMLSFVLFLAVLGSLYENGRWPQRFLIFMQVVCAMVPIIAFMLEAMILLCSAVLVILAFVMIVFTSTHKAKRWIDSDRI
ncbi:MAG: hypothetical protein FWD92_00905 [Methanomassiliicoccaceae archaeon]|nr:hypothetical protein [Methanomassiliicoccaceae archaeon]